MLKDHACMGKRFSDTAPECACCPVATVCEMRSKTFKSQTAPKPEPRPQTKITPFDQIVNTLGQKFTRKDTSAGDFETALYRDGNLPAAQISSSKKSGRVRITAKNGYKCVLKTKRDVKSFAQAEEILKQILL